MKEYNRAIDWIIYSFRLRNSMSKCRLIIDYIIACIELNSKAHLINTTNPTCYIVTEIGTTFNGELVVILVPSINHEIESVDADSKINNVSIINTLYELNIGSVEELSNAEIVEALTNKLQLHENVKESSKIHNPNIVNNKSEIKTGSFGISAIGWNDIIYEPKMENIGFDSTIMIISDWQSVSIVIGSCNYEIESDMESLFTFIDNIKHSFMVDEIELIYSSSATHIPLEHSDAKLDLSVDDIMEANNTAINNKDGNIDIELSGNSRCHLNRKRLLSEMYGRTLGSIKTTVVNSWYYITI